MKTFLIKADTTLKIEHEIEAEDEGCAREEFLELTAHDYPDSITDEDTDIWSVEEKKT